MTLLPVQKDLYKSMLDSSVLMEDIHDFLKKYKDDNKEIIRLSGTKGDLIENIFEAIDLNIIKILDVQAIIKDAEEFGDQHIFIYSLQNGNLRSYYDNANNIGTAIIPATLRNTFPRLINQPQQLEWVDFRYPNRGVTNSWLMKLYDIKYREIKENESFDSTTYKRTIVYKREETKLIYIAEWNGVDEIEIKVSRSSFDSTKSLMASVGQIKNIIHKPANGVYIDRDFTKTNLISCINNLIINSAANQAVFKLISAKFVDKEGGMATIKAVDDQGNHDLLSEDSRKEAIDAYLNGDASGTGLVIRFLATGSNGVLKNDINVIIGKDDVNHLIIPAKIKSLEYKYVRRKIAEFS
jgi:hypothetical protein